MDRFGADHGRSLFAAGTPFAQRLRPPDLLDPTRLEIGLRTFQVQPDVPVVAGVVAPWFGQPSVGVRLDLAADVWTLPRDGPWSP